MIIHRAQIRAHAHAWMYVCMHIINYTHKACNKRRCNYCVVAFLE